MLTFLMMAALGSVPGNVEGWKLGSRDDPIRDLVEHYAQMRDGDVSVTMRCIAKKGYRGVAAEITLPEYVGDGDRKGMYRIDQGKPVRAYWRSVNVRSGSALTPLMNATFVRDLRKASVLAVEVQTYNRSAKPIVKIINVSGVIEAVSHLEAICNR